MKEYEIQSRVRVCAPQELPADDRELLEAAQRATLTSHAPYSHFHVGAAARLSDGTLFFGSNQEAAAFPSGMCAERTLLYAVAAQHPGKRILALAIAAQTGGCFLDTPITPCGACRQVMIETEDRQQSDIRVLLHSTNGVHVLESVRQLLPLSFVDSSLNGQTEDFDRLIDRRGTDAVKHSALQEWFGRSDLLPLWVADMDFATPSFVLDALRRRLEHPILGYTVVPDAFWTAIRQWLFQRHDWQVEREWLTFIPGIVKGIGMVVNVFVRPDERVIIQPPVYHPFRLVPEGNGRQVVMNPLIEEHDAEGRLTGYRMDLEGLEQLAADPRNRLLILANPHNPAGIVWDRQTLAAVADICTRHDVLVVSDEIHSDMALFGHRHVPFASVSPAAVQCSITFASPSKTFNLAGIVSSFAVVPNPQLRERFFGWLDASEMASPTLLAPIATIAAFSPQGEAWRRRLVSYLEGNVRFVEDHCHEYLPAVEPLRPGASFLVWLDCRKLGLSHSELVSLFVDRARLALNDGAIFGPQGEGFMRLNIGTPRSVLRQAMEQLREALAQT